MLKLQTKVQIPDPGFRISYADSLTLLGSCFSDNIGNNLLRNKFRASVNPFGVLYNPASIAQSISVLLNKERFFEEDLDFNNELWFSFNHHSSFSNTNKQLCLERVNTEFLKAKKQIKNTSVLFLTLGTAWAYRLNSNGRVVANCHKLPAKEFTRFYLSPAEIVEKLKEVVSQVRTLNPELKVVFTVSPIRHWKDGAIENQRSKSALILAVKELEETLHAVYYFPSYEVFMDELRDYRFYASDMLHPSEFAIDYLWALFKNTFFSDETLALNKKVFKLVKSFEHRTFNNNTDQYKLFVKKLISDSLEIEKGIPYINFSAERAAL